MMTVTFRGASAHSLDDKSRLIVPKRILGKLPAENISFVLTAGQDKCLLLMSKEDFDSKVKDLEADPFGDDPVLRSKLRRLLGHAEDVKPDKAGRIVLSEALRRYMGLAKDEREVVVVGMGGSIELWSATQWQIVIDEPAVGDTASTSSFSNDASVGSDGGGDLGDL